jgi:hypothetical protein
MNRIIFQPDGTPMVPLFHYLHVSCLPQPALVVVALLAHTNKL